MGPTKSFLDRAGQRRRDEVLPMESGILSSEELAEITGYKARGWQRRWLKDHHWHFVESRSGGPLAGRQTSPG